MSDNVCFRDRRVIVGINRIVLLSSTARIESRRNALIMREKFAFGEGWLNIYDSISA